MKSIYITCFLVLALFAMGTDILNAGGDGSEEVICDKNPVTDSGKNPIEDYDKNPVDDDEEGDDGDDGDRENGEETGDSTDHSNFFRRPPIYLSSGSVFLIPQLNPVTPFRP